MAQGQPGADSSIPVTQAMIDGATQLFGAKPVFWGRYFTSVFTTGNVEYRHALENPLLGNAGIKLLPICRQTTHVAGSTSLGIADGNANAKDFITTFGVEALVAQGGSFAMFLDVEGIPSLSADYYSGWVQGLSEEAQALSNGVVNILPAVYAAQSDITTWNVLANLIAGGARCIGVWVARYFTGKSELGDWRPDIVTPKQPVPFRMPILAWQYADNGLNGTIDCSQVNPAIDLQNDLLQFLVLPPA